MSREVNLDPSVTEDLGFVLGIFENSLVAPTFKAHEMDVRELACVAGSVDQRFAELDKLEDKPRQRYQGRVDLGASTEETLDRWESGIDVKYAKAISQAREKLWEIHDVPRGPEIRAAYAKLDNLEARVAVMGASDEEFNAVAAAPKLPRVDRNGQVRTSAILDSETLEGELMRRRPLDAAQYEALRMNHAAIRNLASHVRRSIARKLSVDGSGTPRMAHGR